MTNKPIGGNLYCLMRAEFRFLKVILVSKGYTSVLYGPNTLGGAVNIITKKPTDKLELDFRA